MRNISSHPLVSLILYLSLVFVIWLVSAFIRDLLPANFTRNIDYFFAVAAGVGVIVAGINHFHGMRTQKLRSDLLSQGTSRSQLEPRLGLTLHNFTTEIRRDLFADDHQLSHVLTLCLSVCLDVGGLEEYQQWLRKELTGYKDYETFKEEFPTEQVFDAWMDKWAKHRMVRPYLKLSYHLNDTGGIGIKKLDLSPLFVPEPVNEIAEKIRYSREHRIEEYSERLQELDPHQYDDIKSFTAKEYPQMKITSDIRGFWEPSSYNDILTGIRKLVLAFLDEVERRSRRPGM